MRFVRITGLAVFLLPFTVYVHFAVENYKAYTFAHYDPGWMVRAVQSLVEDFDLDLKNQLSNDPTQIEDQIALGKNGEWYPLHEVLMPIVTVPFFLFLKVNGCLLFNIFISSLFVVLIYKISQRYVMPLCAGSAAFLTAFTSNLIDYSYSYSVDVFGAFFLVLAFYFVTRFNPLSAGFTFGIAVLARHTNAVTLPAFLLFLYLNKLKSGGHLQSVKTLIAYCIGGLPCLFILMTGNWLMFGSPFELSYDNWARYINGEVVNVSKREFFQVSVFQGLQETIFSRTGGLLIGTPLLIIGLLFGFPSYWKQARNESFFFVFASLSIILLYSSYELAAPGTGGNRYFLSIAAFNAIPLSFALKRLFDDRSKL